MSILVYIIVYVVGIVPSYFLLSWFLKKNVHKKPYRSISITLSLFWPITVLLVLPIGLAMWRLEILADKIQAFFDR